MVNFSIHESRREIIPELHGRISWGLRVILIAYAVIAGSLLFTGGPPPNPGGYGSMVNLTPLATIIDTFTVGNDTAKLFLLINALMLVPVGFFMAFERIRPTVATAGLVLISLSVETLQYFLPQARSSDVDDLIVNSLGGIAAYLIIRRILALRARDKKAHPGS